MESVNPVEALEPLGISMLGKINGTSKPNEPTVINVTPTHHHYRYHHHHHHPVEGVPLGGCTAVGMVDGGAGRIGVDRGLIKVDRDGGKLRENVAPRSTATRVCCIKM